MLFPVKLSEEEIFRFTEKLTHISECLITHKTLFFLRFWIMNIFNPENFTAHFFFSNKNKKFFYVSQCNFSMKFFTFLILKKISKMITISMKTVFNVIWKLLKLKAKTFEDHNFVLVCVIKQKNKNENHTE